MNIKKIENIINAISDSKEKALLKRMLDLSYRAQKTYSITYTDFIDPFLLGKIKTYQLEVLGFNLFNYGGMPQSERQIIAFSPDNFIVEKEDFPIGILKVSVSTGIGKPLTHRDYLGAIMGLGIEREKIGDLVIRENEAFIMVHEEILEYILFSLDSISRYGKVTCQRVESGDIPSFQQEYKIINTTISSSRADALIAAGFKLSRTAVTKLIAAQRALCNGVIITQASPVKEGDICTLRGVGKIKIKEIGSVTRKGRLRVEIHRYI